MCLLRHILPHCLFSRLWILCSEHRNWQMEWETRYLMFPYTGYRTKLCKPYRLVWYYMRVYMSHCLFPVCFFSCVH